jgi:hypothetical protein
MRKALVGIAAALMLTTLVIAIVPAFAQPVYFFMGQDQTYWLWVYPTLHTFYLYSYSYPVSQSYLCNGYGVVVVHGVLTILGACTTLTMYGNTYTSYYKGVLSGGGKISSTTPIKLVLTIVSKPPTKPMTFTLYFVPPT